MKQQGLFDHQFLEGVVLCMQRIVLGGYVDAITTWGQGTTSTKQVKKCLVLAAQVDSSSVQTALSLH